MDSSLCREGRKTMGRFIFVSFGLLVVFLSLSGTGAGFCCPLGWSSYDQHCYRVFKELKTWDDAESFCQTQHRGSRLASIHSSGEEAFVGQLASQTLKFTSMWLGLKDPWKECIWKWSDDARLDYKALTRRPYCTVMVVKTGLEEDMPACGANTFCLFQSQEPSRSLRIASRKLSAALTTNRNRNLLI